MSDGFQPGVPSNALTSLIAKGVRKHLKSKGVEVKHSDILTGVAQALGFENANALRALAEAGEHPRGSVPYRHARYFRTRYVFDVLAEDEPLTTHDLSEIDHETDSGRCVGHMRTAHVTPLTAHEMHAALLDAGNDGSFFEALSDEVDDSPVGRLIAALAPLRAAGEAMDPNDAARAIHDAGDWDRLTPEQRSYLMGLLIDRVTLVAVRPTGPDALPGALARALRAAEAMPLLAAPTAKSARALEDAAGLPAMTLQQALGPVRAGASRLDNTVVVAHAELADPQDLIDLARALPASRRLILLGDPDARPAYGPSAFAELIRRPDLVSVQDSRRVEVVEEAHHGSDGSVLDPAQYSHDVRYLTPNLRALLRLTARLWSGLNGVSLADARRLAERIAAQGLDRTVAAGQSAWRADALLTEVDPDGALRASDPRVLVDKLDALIAEIPADTPIAAVLARRHVGIELTLIQHGPRHVSPDHVMPLLTRLLAQEMRNAIAAGETPTLREAHDSIAQGGERLWADIDPGVEMTRIDAGTMTAILKALVDAIGGEADLEELLRSEGIDNPHAHRSVTTANRHHPDGDRPVLEGKTAYLADVSYVETLTGTRDDLRFLLIASDPGQAERTAGRLVAGLPDARPESIRLERVEPADETSEGVEAILPAVSIELRRICTHLAKDADYALTLERVLRFVRTHSAEHLKGIVGADAAPWSRDLLVAELAALAAESKRGWQDEETVARLA